MIIEKTITKKSQEYTKFKALYRNAFPRAERYGSVLLDLISHHYPQNRIILDIEAEDSTAKNNEQRIGRKAFYERNGYVESGIEYRWRGVPYIILVGSVTEAAKLLFISQPSLSNSIKETEKEAGITIFHRSRTGITLTKKEI